MLEIAFPLYLNTLPLLYYLPEIEGVKTCLEVPARINKLIAVKKIAGGLASSIFYARTFQNLLILPDVSISAVGKIKSVCLFHRVPLEELKGKLLAISPETETSLALLRLILEKFKGVIPRYVVLRQPWSELSQAEKEAFFGYLAIGNEALTFLNHTGYFPLVTDLAEIWLEETGLPFVFALLTIREEVAEANKEILSFFAQKLYLSRAQALSSLESLVKNYSSSLSKDFLLQYLHHLEYDFSGLKQKAFLYFCQLLQELDLLPEIPRLRFVKI